MKYLISIHKLLHMYILLYCGVPYSTNNINILNAYVVLINQTFK